MKKKYIDGSSWHYMAEYISSVKRIEEPFKGYISMVYCESIKDPILVDYDDSDDILIDSGYKCLVFLPDDEHYCISAIYNELNEIVEWYIDMTKENGYDGKPYFLDLYLDIAMSPNKKPVILDEDELLEAYTNKVIKKADVDLAYSTCDKVMNSIITDMGFLEVFLFNNMMTMYDELTTVNKITVL